MGLSDAVRKMCRVSLYLPHNLYSNSPFYLSTADCRLSRDLITASLRFSNKRTRARTWTHISTWSLLANRSVTTGASDCHMHNWTKWIDRPGKEERGSWRERKWATISILSKQREAELRGDVIAGVRQGRDRGESFHFCFYFLPLIQSVNHRNPHRRQDHHHSLLERTHTHTCAHFVLLRT